MFKILSMLLGFCGGGNNCKMILKSHNPVVHGVDESYFIISNNELNVVNTEVSHFALYIILTLITKSVWEIKS